MVHVLNGGPDAEASQQPIYFRSGEHTLFGWLHRPADPGNATGLAVVICEPFGYEALCGHRGIREFAQSAASVGIPTLRFDYLGTGDSAELPAGADQLEAWRLDIAAAIDEVRRLTGSERVCLVGFRLGATLAAYVAAGRTDVCALAAIAPVVSGRRYLREMRTMRLAAAERSHVSTPANPAAPAGSPESQSLEVGGFVIEPPTIEALAPLDLTKLSWPPSVKHLLIVDREDLPGAKAWAESLRETPLECRYESLPGIPQMMMTEPQVSVVPTGIISATQAWLVECGRATDAKPLRQADAARPEVTALVLPPRTAGGPQLTERPVTVSTEPNIFGVLTQPSTANGTRRGVILLNDGSTHHIGSSRMAVELARTWASRGYHVLRLDLAGLGDSATRSGAPSNEPYPTAVMTDAAAAIAFMREHTGIEDLTLSGLCSGGYHALRAAAGGMKVNRIFCVNPLIFFWEDGVSGAELRLSEAIHNTQRYRRKALSGNALKRILTGQINFQRVAGMFVSRIRMALSSSADQPGANGETAAYRNLVKRVNNFNLGRELEQIASRGVQVTFVFSRGESGLELLDMLAKDSLARLGDRCRIHQIDGADHIFSQGEPRRELLRVLSEELYNSR